MVRQNLMVAGAFGRGYSPYGRQETERERERERERDRVRDREKGERKLGQNMT
jgi:hypothetical protein